MNKPILGIIGGGQLGSFLATAAKKLEIKSVVYSDDIDAPAKNFSEEFVYGEYKDKDAINKFLNKVDIITYEFENIPYETLNYINSIKKVLPKPKINKIVQDRLSEKDLISKCNLRTTHYVSVKNSKDLRSNSNLIPGILKTCRLGYDGKGQYKINSFAELNKINPDFKKDYILEKLVNLKKEFSIILTRFGINKYEIYEPIENLHEDQILKHSKIPADINKDLFEKSQEWATLIAEELSYIGTLCVEYFVDKNNNLYVNEIAPRVHNSGHLTINTHNISQFENHIRAVCGLEKIKLEKKFNGEMINLIGEEILLYKNKTFNKNEYFFDYLKKDIREKRKMGHITKIKEI